MTDLNKRLQMLDVGSVLQFYKLEIPNVNTPLLFHCNGVIERTMDDPATMPAIVQGQSMAYGTIEAPRVEQSREMYWLGEAYRFTGIRTEGMRLSGDGSVNSPQLEVSNNIDGVQGAVSALCRLYNNLSNAKLTIYFTTLEAYELGLPQYKTQYWWVSQKTLANDASITFALDMPANHNRKALPTRLIDDICAWAKRGEYRGADCGYTGTNYFDEKGNPVGSIALDSCGGLCEDCTIRFGKGEALPFGGALVSYMRR